MGFLDIERMLLFSFHSGTEVLSKSENSTQDKSPLLTQLDCAVFCRAICRSYALLLTFTLQQQHMILLLCICTHVIYSCSELSPHTFPFVQALREVQHTLTVSADTLPWLAQQQLENTFSQCHNL